MEESPCSKCNKITVSIRQGRCHYICNECGYDKSLSDIYWNEATQSNGDKNNG